VKSLDCEFCTRNFAFPGWFEVGWGEKSGATGAVLLGFQIVTQCRCSMGRTLTASGVLKFSAFGSLTLEGLSHEIAYGWIA
jgi:hypothetical protein